MNYQGFAKLVLCLLLGNGLGNTPLIAQTSTSQKAEARQSKIDLILRAQDTRTIFDGKLISLLTDEDPVIRERAVFAFGSIQDSASLSLLVDRLSRDPNPSVQYAAAFAIGQTAGQLSTKSREELEHDLIWARLDRLPDDERSRRSPADRLIEEVGKFGTEAGLNELILRFGATYPVRHQYALIMCAARFAIRGITTPDAVKFLVRLAKSGDTAPWQAVYALQRIGDNPDIRSELELLIPLYKHPNPLVRMNLATLLGKVRDAKIGLDPLQRLADFDNDWRVRVNALKALGNYRLQNSPDIIQTFRRSFLQSNLYVGLTAISAFGNTGLKNDTAIPAVKETFAAVERIAVNSKNEYLWQLQGEAAGALARLEGRSAARLIKPTDWPQPKLQAQLLVALGVTGAPEALKVLRDFTGDEDRERYRASLEGLRELSVKNKRDSAILVTTYDAAIKALQSKDVALVATAASILGDSLFLRSASVNPLLAALADQHLPDDVESIQEIVNTLGRLRDPRAIEPLREQFQRSDRSVMLASLSALHSITGRDYQSSLPKYFEPSFEDFDFAYLHGLPDTVRVKVETLRGDIIMELYKNYAPFTVMSFLKLATQRGFYRGTPFHRVVPNFVIQGGDQRGDGWGGPGYTIRSEFSPLRFEVGTVGMASAGKDTEGSQFFITQSPQPHLDGRYTIMGKVISGRDVVDKIQLDDHIFDIKVLP